MSYSRIFLLYDDGQNLLVEESGVPALNSRPLANIWHTLSHVIHPGRRGHITPPNTSLCHIGGRLEMFSDHPVKSSCWLTFSLVIVIRCRTYLPRVYEFEPIHRHRRMILFERLFQLFSRTKVKWKFGLLKLHLTRRERRATPHIREK